MEGYCLILDGERAEPGGISLFTSEQMSGSKKMSVLAEILQVGFGGCPEAGQPGAPCAL